MEGGEIRNFIGVWSTATISGFYCYAVSKSTRPGPLVRLLLLLPAAAAFTALPLTLSSCHLGGVTFYSLTWLANFKLILLSFQTGPLAGPPAASSVSHFLCTLLLPVNLSDGPARSASSRAVRRAKAVAFAVKVLCFGLLVVPYSHKEKLSETAFMALHCVHTYLLLEITLALIGALTRAGLGLKLDLEVVLQFDEPYLSSSLQDLWGRRWNLITIDILKQTIHNRIRNHGSRLIGKTPAISIGVLTSFFVSGLMHELGYYYVTRVNCNWKFVFFFMVHGVCVSVEVIVKKTVPTKWQLHRAISTLLTLGLFNTIAVWSLFPPLLKSRVYEKACEEYLVMVYYVKTSVVYVLGVEQ